MWWMLFLVFTLSGMEDGPLSPEVVARRIEAIYEGRPIYKRVLGIDGEYGKTKKIVQSYLQQLQHESYEEGRKHAKAEAYSHTSSIEVLLEAARKTSDDRRKQTHALSLSSKVKISVGCATFLIGLGQLVNGVVFTAREDCDYEYKATSDFLSGIGLMSTSAMVIYNGIKNTDAKADQGRAEHIELMLLQKYKDLRSKE
jgi:hypothetical protein